MYMYMYNCTCSSTVTMTTYYREIPVIQQLLHQPLVYLMMLVSIPMIVLHWKLYLYHLHWRN